MKRNSLWRFEVAERGDVNQIVEEWKLQSSGLTDGEAIEFSGISNADYLVGTFNGINDYYGIFACIQMIDILDDLIINTASIDGEISEKNELYTWGESLVEQLVNDTNTKMDIYLDKKNKRLTFRKQLKAQKEKEEQKRRKKA